MNFLFVLTCVLQPAASAEVSPCVQLEFLLGTCSLSSSNQPRWGWGLAPAPGQGAAAQGLGAPLLGLPCPGVLGGVTWLCVARGHPRGILVLASQRFCMRPASGEASPSPQTGCPPGGLSAPSWSAEALLRWRGRGGHVPCLQGCPVVTPGAHTSWPSAGRHHLLLPQVPDIMSIIHSKLQEVDEEHIRKAAQQTVYILASQHKSVVVSSLLGSALPFDRYRPAPPRWPRRLHVLSAPGLGSSFGLSCS